MTRILIVLVCLSGALPAGCRGVEPPPHQPWLKSMVDKLESDPLRNPPARLYRYTYRDATVYYLPAACCDIPSELFDAAGRLVCLPDGGFTGDGDGRCTDFFATRSGCELVWADPRAKAGPALGCDKKRRQGPKEMER